MPLQEAVNISRMFSQRICSQCSVLEIHLIPLIANLHQRTKASTRKNEASCYSDLCGTNPSVSNTEQRLLNIFVSIIPLCRSVFGINTVTIERQLLTRVNYNHSIFSEENSQTISNDIQLSMSIQGEVGKIDFTPKGTPSDSSGARKLWGNSTVWVGLDVISGGFRWKQPDPGGTSTSIGPVFSFYLHHRFTVEGISPIPWRPTHYDWWLLKWTLLGIWKKSVWDAADYDSSIPHLKIDACSKIKQME